MFVNSTRDLIIKLRRDGMRPSAIATELKLTRNQVAGVLFRAGLTKKMPTKTASLGRSILPRPPDEQ